MITITGIDAVMIYADDPAALARWYETHLGIATSYNPADGNYYADGGVPDRETGHCVRFGIYAAPPHSARARRTIMVNYRVDDFDAALAGLKADGLEIADVLEEGYGRFAHFTDPEGNPIEIWSPRALAHL